MLILDSNIFLYARGHHPHSQACRDMIAKAGEHSDWVVPLLVLLEITHYLADGGDYGRRIGPVFGIEPSRFEDFEWAALHAESHEDFNDHLILQIANRLGADGVVSYDRFFDRQVLCPGVMRREPPDVI